MPLLIMLEVNFWYFLQGNHSVLFTKHKHIFLQGTRIIQNLENTLN